MPNQKKEPKKPEESRKSTGWSGVEGVEFQPDESHPNSAQNTKEHVDPDDQ